MHFLENYDKLKYSEAGRFEKTRFEKIHNVVFKNSSIASKLVAHEIADLILNKKAENQMCVLGLATGSSPILVYQELIHLHKEHGLSFENVITFNLDEYFPIEKENQQSYHNFMNEHLFNHIDIDLDNINIPDGTLDISQVHDFCLEYERKIDACGGIDYQLLGIGRTGHVGFNEPGSHKRSATRMINLDHLTRFDAIKDFNSIADVPRQAITMGVGSISKSKRIVLLAWGEKKASVVKKTIENEITSNIPASYLQTHGNVTFVLDDGASEDLTRIKTPWKVDHCKWTHKLMKKAVVWLSLELQKPILKLTDRDYNDHGMSELLTKEGSAYDINIKVFSGLQRTITGWPGGKPNADDSNRPERSHPKRKRVIIFSPHPDDDIISMGGTFSRLVEQGHDVYVAYQTSGNIAVTDEEALKFVEVAYEIASSDTEKKIFKEHIDFIRNKNQNKIDAIQVRKLKGLIRQKESMATTRFIGLKDENVRFLNLPFYETGQVKKSQIGEQDIRIIENLIEEIKPNQIYAAGDLADPHGTHKVCLDAIFKVLDRLKSKSYMKDCWVWLYRGAWHEWQIEEIDMTIPMSPDQVDQKRMGVLFHQSQKDRVMFQGEDSREFWMRAEERNKQTAKLYDKLGLPEYEAMEAFKRYFF